MHTTACLISECGVETLQDLGKHPKESSKSVETHFSFQHFQWEEKCEHQLLSQGV